MTDYRYTGRRTRAGCRVTVQPANGTGDVPRPLDPRHDLADHSPDGFEWGYGGSGPAQLALALLAHHRGDDRAALRGYQAFKWTVVAQLPAAGWTLTSTGIEAAMRLIEADDTREATR